MTTAEALLAVLGPGATFFATIATVAVKRHFRFIDRIETRLEKYLDEASKTSAAMVEEMRLSRAAREEQDVELAGLIAEMEKELGRKLDDKRMSELRAAVEELRAKRSPKSDPPIEPHPVHRPAEVDTAGRVIRDAEVTPVTCDPVEEELERRGSRRQKTDPALRAVPAVAPRPALRSAGH